MADIFSRVVFCRSSQYLIKMQNPGILTQNRNHPFNNDNKIHLPVCLHEEEMVMTASTSPAITKACRYCIFLSAGIAFFLNHTSTCRNSLVNSDYLQKIHGSGKTGITTSAAGAGNPGMIFWGVGMDLKA